MIFDSSLKKEIARVKGTASHIVGNLWVGSWPDAYDISSFQYIVRCCPFREYPVASHQVQARAFLHDSDNLPDKDQLNILADLTRFYMEKGPTLVHCKGGINRSGLVAALALMRIGVSPEKTVSLLRTARSPAMLANQTFEDYIRSLPDKVT